MTNYLDGFKVFKTPVEPTSRSRYHFKETIEAFLESGESCMGKEFGKHASYVAKGYNHQAKINNLPVTATSTRGWVYLVRLGDSLKINAKMGDQNDA